MTQKVCEYDGTPVTRDSQGREEACPTCALDIAAHNARCSQCAMMTEEMGKRD